MQTKQSIIKTIDFIYHFYKLCVTNIKQKKQVLKRKKLYINIPGNIIEDNFMTPITILRQMVKNGWTIANRRNIISQIGKSNFDEIALLAKKQVELVISLNLVMQKSFYAQMKYMQQKKL